jgi:hypothetical protein
MFHNKLYWSCIDIVIYYTHCTYQEALDLLWNKGTKLILTSNKIQSTKLFFPEIRFDKKDWKEPNLFMLSGEILEKELVFLVKDYWIKSQSGWNKNSLHNPHHTLCIAYYFPETNHVKLYFPNESDFKWYSNCSTQDIFGYHKIKYYQSHSDELVITKSGKDRLILDYFIGKASIALQNEGCFIPEDKFLDLQMMFKNIWFLYDNDISGILQSQKLSEKYKLQYKTIDVSPKDPYEMIQLFGIENTKKLI